MVDLSQKIKLIVEILGILHNILHRLQNISALSSKSVFPRKSVFRRSSRYVNQLVDTIMPPQSLLSGGLKMTRDDAVHWTTIRFLDEPCCDICGFPFEFDMGKGALCARCIARPPNCSHIRAAFAYDDASRKMVLDFKHGGNTMGLSMFGFQMARAGRLFLKEADFIVPVPLHYKRLVKRRYNQSALIARSVARHGSVIFDADILRRHKATETQGGKTVSGRRRNVNGAFSVPEKAKDKIQGAKIILVDDVLTTGATLDACAKTLLREGAASVYGLTLARVVRGIALPT